MSFVKPLPIAAGPFADPSVASPTLRDAVGPDRHLRVRCRCGRERPVWIDYWMMRGWEGRHLIGLTDYVRCICLSRLTELFIADGPARPGDHFYQPF